MSSSTKVTESIDACQSCVATSMPYSAAQPATPRFEPTETWPPLRPLAPQATVLVSKTATEAPPLASVRAAERPVSPPPMTATSTDSGSGVSAGGSLALHSRSACQKTCSIIAHLRRPPAALRLGLGWYRCAERMQKGSRAGGVESNRRTSPYSVSRCTGVKPAARMSRTISSTVMVWLTPAALTTFSSIIVEPMSLAPKASATWPMRRPWVTHEACTLGTLSR